MCHKSRKMNSLPVYRNQVFIHWLTGQLRTQHYGCCRDYFLQFLRNSSSNTLMSFHTFLLLFYLFEVFNYLLIWVRDLDWMICSLIGWRFLVNNNTKFGLFLLQSYVAYINIKCLSQTDLYDTFWCFIPLSIHYNCEEKSDPRKSSEFLPFVFFRKRKSDRFGTEWWKF